MPHCVLCSSLVSTRIRGVCYDCNENIFNSSIISNESQRHWTNSSCSSCGDSIGSESIYYRSKEGELQKSCLRCRAGKVSKIPRKYLCRHCNKGTVNHSAICTECIEWHIIRCNWCREAFTTKEVESNPMHYDDLGNCHCQDCTQHVKYCRQCGALCGVSSDTCGRCRQRARNVVKNYSFKPTPIFYSLNKGAYFTRRNEEKTQKNLFLGVELEVANKYDSLGVDKRGLSRTDTNTAGLELLSHNKDIEDKYIYLKSDSSIDGGEGGGFEIVTHPMTLAFHKRFAWEKIFSYLIKSDFRSYNTSGCGLHIHVNSNYFTESEKMRVSIFFAAYMEQVVKIARRPTSSFAKHKKIQRNLSALEKTGRGEAINWGNSNTIEFRAFKGTLSYTSFMASLEFVDSVCNFIKKLTISSFSDKERVWDYYVEFIRTSLVLDRTKGQKRSKKYDILYRFLAKRDLIKLTFKENDAFKDKKIRENEGGGSRYFTKTNIKVEDEECA